jgi:hypothetical protein
MNPTANEMKRIATAIQMIIDHMEWNENRHFRESLDCRNYSDAEFVAKFKEHILYSVLVLKYDGNCEKINDIANELLEEQNDWDEDEEDIKEVKCDCFADDESVDEEESAKREHKDEFPDHDYCDECGCCVKCDCCECESEYFLEKIECVKCNKEKPRKEMNWNGGAYTDTCCGCFADNDEVYVSSKDRNSCDEYDSDDMSEEDFKCDRCKKVKHQDHYISIPNDDSGNTICDKCVEAYVKENKIPEESDDDESLDEEDRRLLKECICVRNKNQWQEITKPHPFCKEHNCCKDCSEFKTTRLDTDDMWRCSVCFEYKYMLAQKKSSLVFNPL